MNLHKGFQEFGPWITRFIIDGEIYGGDFDAMNDGRVNQFFECFPDAQTILELGSLEGGHTFALSKRHGVKQVVGIEGRKSNIDKARFIQKLLDIRNVEFINENLETFNLSGKFDAVFCVGLLYHLPKPWDLIDKVSNVSKNLFIWTHYANEAKADQTVNGHKGIIHKEFGLADPLSGMSAESFWPTLEGLKMMLSSFGFTRIHTIEDNPTHQNGPCVTLAAIIS